jgi:hypothetical protein
MVVVAGMSRLTTDQAGVIHLRHHLVIATLFRHQAGSRLRGCWYRRARPAPIREAKTATPVPHLRHMCREAMDMVEVATALAMVVAIVVAVVVQATREAIKEATREVTVVMATEQIANLSATTHLQLGSQPGLHHPTIPPSNPTVPTMGGMVGIMELMVELTPMTKAATVEDMGIRGHIGDHFFALPIATRRLLAPPQRFLLNCSVGLEHLLTLADCDIQGEPSVNKGLDLSVVHRSMILACKAPSVALGTAWQRLLLLCAPDCPTARRLEKPTLTSSS